jgi:hypothetical protein
MPDPSQAEPFTVADETRATRRNLLLASSLAFFIGYSGVLPKEVSFLGLKFNSDQQESVSWFIFFITLFLFLRFLSSLAVELSVYLKPKAYFKAYKKNLLAHPAFDETDWMDIAPPADPYNLDEVQDEAKREAKWSSEKTVRPLERFVWLKLLLETLLPVVFPIVAMIYLVCAINQNAEQDGADQPATAPKSKIESNMNPKPKSEVRSQ